MADGAVVDRADAAIITGKVDVWNHVPIPAQAPATEGYADTKPVKLWYWDTGGAGQRSCCVTLGRKAANVGNISSRCSPRPAIA